VQGSPPLHQVTAMSRVFVNPQAGRDRHTRNASTGAEDAWGTTSSQAQFRGYEPAEMRNCRSQPQHVKAALEKRSDTGRKARQYNWDRTKEDFPDHSAVHSSSARSLGSAVTCSEQSRSRSFATGSRQGTAPKPEWATIHERPIPPRTFDSNSAYASQQDFARQSRHEHFPYRDEFAPRSKRLLYELAYLRASRDSVRSGSTADSVSCFTMSSAAQNSAHGARRSASVPSVASSTHTAASSRVIGGIAKRRHEAFLRSPSLSDMDKQWYDEKMRNEGPAGLFSSNFTSGFHTNNLDKYAERMNQERHTLCGVQEADLPQFG